MLFSVIVIYAVGGCILSGIFSVGETKILETLSAKIHGYLFAYRGEAKKYHSMAAPDEKVLPYLAARHENPCPIQKKMATRKTPYREPSLKAENESAQGGIRVTG